MGFGFGRGVRMNFSKPEGGERGAMQRSRGKAVQADGIACAKALRQDRVWCVGGTAGSVWLERSK